MSFPVSPRVSFVNNPSKDQMPNATISPWSGVHIARQYGSIERVKLPIARKLAYGVGHVFNDLCSAMWFTYLLIFLNKVILLSSKNAGALILIGQIADGVSTPIVGFLSDRSGNLPICAYGRRKTWHLVGTICTTASFPFIFTHCLICHPCEVWVRMAYFTVFVIVFQFGWASVQISHLSLAPELTPDEHERTLLFSIRYSFTVISNMVVYIVLWIVLEAGGKEAEAPITPDDKGTFQIVAYSMVALGCVTSLLFHIGTPEHSKPEDDKSSELDGTSKRKTKHKERESTWGLFKNCQLYQVAVMYTATRLFANVSQTMFPMYLHDTLAVGAEMIAVLPLVMYALSFLMATVIKPVNKRYGRKRAYCLGAGVGIAVSVWLELAAGHFYKQYLVFVVAGLYGIATSATVVTSLAITADLVGQDLDNGAFIYGLMSFCDKLASGIAIMGIQWWVGKDHPYLYRDSLAYLCGGVIALGALVLLTLRHTQAPEPVEELHGVEKLDSSSNTVND